ncbi:MAG: DUF5668 domain-containing protein [Anaerolineae bacterium]
MRGRRIFGIIIGLLLILLGVWMLLDALGYLAVSVFNIWPAVLAVVGLIMLIVGLVTPRKEGFRDGALAMFGTWALLLGLFFLPYSIGRLDWGTLAQLWPTFSLIGGIGLMVAFLVEGRRDVGLLIVGAITIIVGAMGYLFTFGVLGATIAALVLPLFVPVLLILVGLGVMVSAFTRPRV